MVKEWRYAGWWVSQYELEMREHLLYHTETLRILTDKGIDADDLSNEAARGQLQRFVGLLIRVYMPRETIVCPGGLP